MAPVVHGLEQQYAGQIEFVYLDTDDRAVKPIMEDLQMVVRPHYFLLDAEGNILDQWVGPISEGEFKRVFEAELVARTVP